MTAKNLTTLRLLRSLIGLIVSYIKGFEKDNMDMADIVEKLKSCISTIANFLFKPVLEENSIFPDTSSTFSFVSKYFNNQIDHKSIIDKFQKYKRNDE